MSVNSATDASIERRWASVGGIDEDSMAAVRSNRRPMPDTMLLPLARWRSCVTVREKEVNALSASGRSLASGRSRATSASIASIVVIAS